MADEIIKRCDYPVKKGRATAPHGVAVESGTSTKFRLDTKEYAVDICDEHIALLSEALAPFIAIARRANTALPKNGRGRTVMRAKGGRTFTTSDVREWLRKTDQPVPETGRLPNALIDAYKEAHSLT